MKSIIFILTILTISLLTSCNNQGNPTPTATLTTFEQQFVGNWFIKSKTSNYNGFMSTGFTSTDTAHCRLQFKDQFYYDYGTTHFFHCDNGLNDCLVSDMGWAGNPPYINLSTLEYEIVDHTSNTLTLKNILGGYENEYHLTKNYNDLYTTCNFTYSVEFNNPVPPGVGGNNLDLTYKDNNGNTQTVDLTGLTTWSQTVSQNFAQSLHTYNYDIELGVFIVDVLTGQLW